MTVTRSDLESKLGEVEAALTSQAEEAKARILPFGVAAVLVLLIVVFLLGKRRGRKATTVVEIRRV